MTLRINPSLLRSGCDHLYSWDGERVDWLGRDGEIVVLVDRTPPKANRVMFTLDSDQLAGMLTKALGTQGQVGVEERQLLEACRAFLAMRDAAEEL